MSAHDEPSTVTLDFGDEVPVLVFSIPDDLPPPVVEVQQGLVFSEPSNSGYLGVI